MRNIKDTRPSRDKIDREKDTTNDEPDHRLYIIMRADIYQMNPGKLGAQAGHAASKFVLDVLANKDNAASLKLKDQMHEWAGDRGFGTKITLEATANEINKIFADMAPYTIQTGRVVDPTYPFTNYFGQFFTSEELTCMYVFVPDDAPKEVRDYLKAFNLCQ